MIAYLSARARQLTMLVGTPVPNPTVGEFLVKANDAVASRSVSSSNPPILVEQLDVLDVPTEAQGLSVEIVPKTGRFGVEWPAFCTVPNRTVQRGCLHA